MSLSKYVKKPLLLLAVGFIVVVGAAFVITYELSSSSDKPPVSSTSPLGTKENPHEVALTSDNQEPIDLVVKTGEYVQFNSKDGKEHQIVNGSSSEQHGATSTGHEGSELSTGIIKSDEGYLLQFNEVGKFDFHDNYNHHYTISVLVYDPSKSAEEIKLKN